MNLEERHIAPGAGLALACLGLAGTLLAPPSSAAHGPSDELRPWCQNVVVPQGRTFRTGQPFSGVHVPLVTVTHVNAAVKIADGVATTELTMGLLNPADRQVEAELMIPLPAGAKVTGLAFDSAESTPAHRLLGATEAQHAYQSLARLTMDSGALEFVGTGALRSSVFPLSSKGEQTVRVVYEETVAAHGQRTDYVLPRSENLALQTPWEIEVQISSTLPIADVYSPTHGLGVDSESKTHRELSVLPGATGRLEAGPLRLSVLTGEGSMATTIFTANDPNGPGGWFLLLAGLGDVPAQAEVPPREVTIVLDRSGSMGGTKFEQAVAAARQVLEGLEFGEAVQIIDYSKTVEQFAVAPVIKTKANLPKLRSYLDGLAAKGGTNLDGALQAALGAPAMEGFVPVVLFLTDGLATEGEQREHVIRDRAIAANVHGRRVFTFGVGHDVNASLLDAVAQRSRARATYVAPGANVEVAVGDVFEDLSGPVMTHLEFEVASADGALDTRMVRDVYPGLMPDLFRGDRLLLLGRYTDERSATLRIKGRKFTGTVIHELCHDFSEGAGENDFVPRLWAMRRIAALEDSLRQQGADPSALAGLKDDPRFAETITEMLELATTHGVLTDSTAFLAREGTELGDVDALVSVACQDSLSNNGFRSGSSGVAQQKNIYLNRSQGWVNSANLLNDSSDKAVASSGLQTIRGRTYIRRGSRWTDGCLALDKAATAKPDAEVFIGSKEYATLFDAMTKAGRGAELSLSGEILIKFEGVVTLIKAPWTVPLAPKIGYELPKGVHH